MSKESGIAILFLALLNSVQHLVGWVVFTLVCLGILFVESRRANQ